MRAVTRFLKPADVARLTLEHPMFVAFILSKICTYQRYRQTIRELTQFTDRELEDLGITRYKIDVIARQNAVS